MARVASGRKTRHPEIVACAAMYNVNLHGHKHDNHAIAKAPHNRVATSLPEELRSALDGGVPIKAGSCRAS